MRLVPDPMAMLGSHKGGIVSREELAQADILQVVLENFDFDLSFRVTGFSITLTGKGRDATEVISDSNRVTAEMKSLIRGSRSGDIIYVEKIRASGPDGTVRTLPPLKYTIQ